MASAWKGSRERRPLSASIFAGSIGSMIAGPAAAATALTFLRITRTPAISISSGAASLFELLNTTRTEIGELTLADWLRGPATLSEVRARQAAVAELRPMLDFREDVAVLASESPVGRTGLLATWAASPAVGFASALRVALAVCALVTIVLGARLYRELIGLEWLFGWLVLEIGFAAIWRRPFHRVLHAIETPEHDLGLLAASPCPHRD